MLSERELLVSVVISVATEGDKESQFVGFVSRACAQFTDDTQGLPLDVTRGTISLPAP